MDNQPYISFVVTSRNDNHGGDLMKRMLIFYNGLIHQCNKFKLHCELIIVDWNSPNPDELVYQTLPDVPNNDYLSVRHIIVPPEIHERYRFSDELNLFQMIAKNVGIRRSYGKFICCTNIDLLFSNELFEELTKKKLKLGTFYRANRCDVPETIDINISTEEQLTFCKENILKRLGKDSKYTYTYDEKRLFFKSKMFTPLLKFLEWLKPRLMPQDEAFFQKIDSDACGDFTMMSKQDWEKTQGYLELEMYSLHIDTLGLFSALAMGIKQEILPQEMCTYHINHKEGWDPQNALDQLKFYHRKPSLDWYTVEMAGKFAIKNKVNFGINSENWGLSDVNLREVVI